MSGEILQYLINKNQFPIIFIGAGISKRYLKDYPSWIELLERLWNDTGNEEDFYAHLLKVQKEIKDIKSKVELEHMVNTIVATDIETNVYDLFTNSKLTIDGLSFKDVYNNNISPFKKLLSNKFSSYELKDNIEDEYSKFKEMLHKAQIIITTNYDCFIENSYGNDNNKLVKYIGENGMFNQSTGYAELYKIHGCCEIADSIIITKKDYEKFDKKSILISSKIISLLLNSPIIFLGYSLTDINVRKIIRDFSTSLSNEELELLENNLIFIDWEKGQPEIIETTEYDAELGCRYKIIKTDNYSKIYDSICSIEQGVTPLEVRKYLHVIKKIIVEKGVQGKLDNILVSNDDLDEIISQGLKDKNLVVAIGDEKLVYVMPTLNAYFYDYINEDFEQNIDTVFLYLLTQHGRIPIKKYINQSNLEKCSLHKDDKERLLNKIKKYNKDETLEKIKSTLKRSFNDFEDIEDIKCQRYNKKYMEYNCIIYNINSIPLYQLKDYLLEELKVCIENKEQPESALRKLVVCYDRKKYN